MLMLVLVPHCERFYQSCAGLTLYYIDSKTYITGLIFIINRDFMILKKDWKWTRNKKRVFFTYFIRLLFVSLICFYHSYEYQKNPK